jgi:SAM-dependent methyltransferase
MILKLFRKLSHYLYENAEKSNSNLLLKLVHNSHPDILLDIGCDNGQRTRRISAAAESRHAFGIEIVERRAQIAQDNGVIVIIADINNSLPIKGSTVDLIFSNQVIEHVQDTDLFLGELMRTLRTGGRTIVSTENLSSWHNIFSTVMGWQPFSLTNISMKRLGIGNPLALLRLNVINLKSWLHIRVFSARGLVELIGEHGFSDIRLHGAGYFPFPAWVGRVNPTHAVFITVCAWKR